MELRYCLNQGILERISKILGDTSNGLTGSEISYFLQQCNIKDVTPEITNGKGFTVHLHPFRTLINVQTKY